MKHLISFLLAAGLTSTLAFAQSDDGDDVHYPDKCLFPVGTTLKFTHESYGDGGTIDHCNEKFIETSPYDWNLTCPNGTAYRIHLSLSKYTHRKDPTKDSPSDPVTYETMFWVNENGATSLIDYKNSAEILKWQSDQSIAGEDAGIRVVVEIPAGAKVNCVPTEKAFAHLKIRK